MLAFILAALSSAQQPIARDGRFWRSSSHDSRQGFILGYADGLTNGMANFTTDAKDIENRFRAAWPDLTNGELEEAITRFYDAPENRPFLIYVALQAIAMKSNGMPQARIDSFLNTIRQQK